MSSDDRPADASSSPTHLSDSADLDAFVAEHEVALVEFYTEGCSKCAAMEPILSGVARTSDLAVGLVNPRDDPALIDRFEVSSVPLLVVFVDGDPVARRAEGFQGVDAVREFVAASRPT
ncbi:thioredoxin family protein [Halobacteriales archaeon Cl-PHB]